jgi:hypothetical protein
MAKEILLVSERPEDAQFASEVAQLTGASLVVEPDPVKCIAAFVNRSPTAIFFDVGNGKRFKAFEAEIQRSIGLFSDKIHPQKLYLLADQELSEQRDLTLSPLFANFSRRYLEETVFQSDFYARFMRGSEDPSFDIGKFLAPGTKIQEAKIQNTKLKLDAVEAVRKYLFAAQFRGRVANLIANAVDELIMNALFDAPVDEFGKPLYSLTSRSVERKLTGQDEVDMRLGFDGNYFAVTISDQYGSVDRPKILKHVSSNYHRRTYQVSSTSAGAGLGLSNIFRAGGSLIYSVEPRVKTEATLIFKTFPNYRTFKHQFRILSVHFAI